MQQWITMTANDATMDVVFGSSFKHPLEAFEFIYKIIQLMKW